MDLALEEILFLDIETIPVEIDLKLDLRALGLLKKRYEREMLMHHGDLKAVDLTAEHFASHLAEVGGFNSEFGKVVCIAVGYFESPDAEGRRKFRLKRMVSENEKELLIDLKGILEKSKRKLCAHNGKEFDYPFLSRRMLIHGLAVPDQLDCRGKKPWQIDSLDTMEMYRMGQFNGRASLDLLAYAFGLPSSKTELNGADVAKLYYGTLPGSENLTMGQKLYKIGTYCGADVIVLASIYCKMTLRPFIVDEQDVVYSDRLEELSVAA